MHKRNLSQLMKRFSFSRICFCCAWMSGLLLGALFAAGSEPSFSLMRLIAQQQVSIVLFWILAVFPFLIAAYAVTVSRQEILLLTCFCHTFFLSFAAVALRKMFGSAGWLLEPMFLFSQNLTLPVLCWFCVRHFEIKRAHVVQDHVLSLICSVILATVQYFAVLPFLGKLIDHS